MNETNQRLLELLKSQVKIRDVKINQLEKEKECLLIFMNSCRQKYKKIMIGIISFSILSFVLNMYFLLF